MLHTAPTSETKADTAQSKTQVVPQPECELHPRLLSTAGPYSSSGTSGVASSDSRDAHRRQAFAGMQNTHGNQAVLRMLHSPQQVARMTSLRPSQPVVLQRKCAGCKAKREGTLQRAATNSVTITGNTSMVIQLASDPTPPQSVLDARSDEDKQQPASTANASEEIDDMGEGVASIEEGTPATPTEGKEEDADSSAIQMKSTDPASGGQRGISPIQIQRRLDSGFSMQPELRDSMESFFGTSLAGVKLHTDRQAGALAASLNAYAFTVGDDIAFAEGKYQPHTTEGKKLMAHELTHVLQQRQPLSGAIEQEGIGHSGDRYELEADRAAEQLVHQDNRLPATSPTVRGESPLRAELHGPFRKLALQLYSAGAAVSYATKYATSTNLAYGRFDNDCTNFVSQAMEAGGWSMIFGSSTCDDRKKDSVWWFLPNGCVKFWLYGINASYTWGGANNFFRFLSASGRGTLAASVWDLDVGDVLQRDYSGSGTVGHTMIVTQKSATNLYLSYHTTDHLNEPFWRDGTNVGIYGRSPSSAKFYGWKIK